MRHVIAVVLVLATLPGAWAQLLPIPQNDAGRGGDAGDDFQNATYLPNPDPTGGATFTGKLIAIDDREDWYSFTIFDATGNPIVVDFSATSDVCAPPTPLGPLMVVTVSLWDPNGVERDSFATTDCHIQPRQIAAPGDMPGDWRIAFTYHSAVAPLIGARTAAHGAVLAGGDADGAILDYVFEIGCKPLC